MRDWLKASLLGTSVFGASWTGAVTYWRAGNRMPSALDLAAWLLVLPLSVLLAVWLGRRMLAARAASAAGAAPDAKAVPAAPPPAPTLPALAILASSVRTPHGAAPAELAKAIGAQRARADLDPELVDDAGFPLLSARVADAVDDDFKQELEDWRIGAGLEDPEWTPEQWRALSLGSAVAGELLMQVADHPQLAPSDISPGKPVQPPLLRLHAGLGLEWNEAQRATVGAWLGALAAQAGWPADRVRAAVLPTSVPALLAQLANEAVPGRDPVLALVLAFDSALGEAGVERLARDGTLFGSDNPQGLIPGEAAAGLLVAGADQAALFDPDAPRLQLASAAREAAEAKRSKPDTALLRQLAGALLRDEQETAAVDALFADTGHRSANLLELMRFAGDALPQLDAGQDLKATGNACGHCGEAPFLAALALAHQHVLDTAGAALCIGNEHPLQRTAALVRPAAA